MAPTPPTLKSLFESHQVLLETGLTQARALHAHPGTKGAALESQWLTLLGEHLSHRYQVSSGFVIDSRGGCSDQIDVIIYDRQYTPLIFNKDGARYLAAESVYAVFEVKPEMNADYIDYAGKKVASVRALHRTNASITHAGGTIYQPKPPLRILGGFLCNESTWSPPFGTPFNAALGKLTAEQQLDLGCVLGHGMFEIPHAAAAAQVQTHPATDGLVRFFLRLLHRLQQVGTVPAIDFEAYLAALDAPPATPVDIPSP